MSAGDVVRLVLVNAGAWAAIHMAWAWGGTQLSPSRFSPRWGLFRIRPWEQGGRVYQRLFGIKRWKDVLPDGSAWFRAGFPKASLSASDPAYMERFIVETCRGEAVHWAVFLSGFLFFLWNSLVVGLVMMGYAVAANLPCILIQRYNRARLQRLLQHRATRDH